MLSAIVPFLPGIGGGFILDDWENIVKNASIHIQNLGIDSILYAAYSFEPGNGSRPLSMLSFALNYWFSEELNPTAFKITNLLIHCLSTIILGLFFQLLLEIAGYKKQHALWFAFILASFWAIHPLQVSSVLYIVQRMQTLGTLFIISALFCYLRFRQKQIEGTPGRPYATLAILFWSLALASKEDSAMLPAYTLALELTVLKFRAANESKKKIIKAAYGILAFIGCLAYLLIVIPHYWYWENYPFRDFSTPDRLLTQGRLLAWYLLQIAIPLPNFMPFFYDGIAISRNFWNPWTTTPAILILIGLLTLAWHWRQDRPLFALGVFLFFSGHFISSNVIGLELGFEHRNHFPLIGATLALGDCVQILQKRLNLDSRKIFPFGCILLTMIGCLTAVRAYSWGEPLRFAQDSLAKAPYSERAWALLCNTYFERSRQKPDSHDLDLAIKTCQDGAVALNHSAILANNIVIYKTIKGTITDGDWDYFLERLKISPATAQIKGILWVTLANAENKRYSNEEAVLKTIEIITKKTNLNPNEYLRLAAYIFNETQEPIKAIEYLKKAVELAHEEDPAIKKMMHQLSEAGRQDWVDQLMEWKRQKILQDKTP